MEVIQYINTDVVSLSQAHSFNISFFPFFLLSHQRLILCHFGGPLVNSLQLMKTQQALRLGVVRRLNHLLHVVVPHHLLHHQREVERRKLLDFQTPTRPIGSLLGEELHRKDPKGATYTRNGKETSWRCSSKSCPAVVRKLKGDTEYKLYNKHTCSQTHGPTDVPGIPAAIQARLGDTQEALAEFVKSGSNANGTQQQGTV